MTITSTTTRRTFIKSLSLLPTAVPLRTPTRRRLLVVEGNSLSSPGNGIATWPQRLAVHPWMRLMNFGVVNAAIGGATIVDLFARAPMVDTLAGIADECYLLVFELTNTMHKFGGDVAGTYQRHREYCAARRAQGFKVLIGTGIDRADELFYKWPTGFTPAQMGELNGMIRATWHEFADGVVDFGACPELGNAGASANPRYYWDGIHLTSDGYDLVLGMMLDALQQRARSYYMPIVGA